MHQSIMIAGVFAVLCGLVPLNSAAEHAPSFHSRPPNIILILADDMGIGDVSHRGGLAPTPHLDRLAAEGTRFNQAYTTSSVCTPTRYSILTGRYNWRSAMKESVLDGTDGALIRGTRITLPEFLVEHGYHTGMVGKWHLGVDWHRLPPRQVPQSPLVRADGEGWDIDYTQRVHGGPNDHGFHTSYMVAGSANLPPFVYLRDGWPTRQPTLNKQPLNRRGAAAADFDVADLLQDFACQARRYIADASRLDRPFFLYLPLTSPHTPIAPSAAWQGRSTLGPYGDFLMETDWVVGEVLAELEFREIDRQTLVVFTADNGCAPAADIDALAALGHDANCGLRGAKSDIFEGGTRVPFIVRWPGVVPADRVTDALVSVADFYATFADLIGRRNGLDPSQAEDSLSFAKVLLGEADAARESVITHSIRGQLAIRRGPWKLLLTPGSGGWSEPQHQDAEADGSLPPVQLYNLDEDPGESKNVWDTEAAVVQQLVQELVTAIQRGRTTPGPDVRNEGWPKTISPRVLTIFPELKGPDGSPVRPQSRGRDD